MSERELCDRCNGVTLATYKITLPSGKVLFFCGFRTRYYQAAVAAQRENSRII